MPLPNLDVAPSAIAIKPYTEDTKTIKIKNIIQFLSVVVRETIRIFVNQIPFGPLNPATGINFLL